MEMMKESIPPILRPRHVEPKAMTALVSNFDLKWHQAGETQLLGISMNTADLRPGDLFVAMPGLKTHGAKFAERAIELGASAIVTDAAGALLLENIEIPVAILEKPRTRLGELAAWVYGNVEGLMPTLFATTGTNGKTSTTYILDAILRQLGQVTGLTSTAERHIASEVIVARLTTPESTEMHSLIARMRESNVESIAIEVSAQALTQLRVDGLRFDVAGFTNLSHDHLDDYGDMQTYFAAKAKLLKPQHARRGVVCLDSEWGQRMLDAAEIEVVSISSDPAKQSDWKVCVTDETPSQTSFSVTSPSGDSLETFVTIIGAHMAHNAGLAIAMICESGVAFDEVKTAVAQGIKAYLPGRTERVTEESGPDVFVDFGHSPDAFLNTLAAVRKVTSGKVIMVFGADGDRDASKRPAMAEVAARGCDLLVVTDHHPRFEDPASIRKTLVEAARSARPELEIFEVSPPEAAIRKAVSLAKPGDSILWAGPGHQDYRDIEGVRTPYSARQEARDALREAGWR
jgi:UDP-N-acetylmuramoyl-L-alanyl-D-glutamate--2,6-diaminopimelate ligase